jgi:hypothetical protein
MAVRATIGFAFGDNAQGVAFVRLQEPGGEAHVQRIAVSFEPRPALLGRDAAYAALLAVAAELRKQGLTAVDFEVDDERVVRDLAEHRTVPAALTVPYVLLGCALNRFRSASVKLAAPNACRDLTARARADVSLHVAA